MLEYITDDLEISSDDADKNNSFEESSIPQNIRNYCFSDSASSLLKYKKFLKNIWVFQAWSKKVQFRER